MELTVRPDGASDDPRWLQPANPHDVLHHRGQLVVGVDEVAAARSNHYIKGDLYLFENILDQRQSRCRPTEVQACAQLESLRSRELGGDGSFHAFNRRLDQYLVSGGQRL